MGHFNIEFYKISIQSVASVVQELMVLFSQLHHAFIEVIDDRVNVFEVMLLKDGELPDSAEQLHQFPYTTGKELKL